MKQLLRSQPQRRVPQGTNSQRLLPWYHLGAVAGRLLTTPGRDEDPTAEVRGTAATATSATATHHTAFQRLHRPHGHDRRRGRRSLNISMILLVAFLIACFLLPTVINVDAHLEYWQWLLVFVIFEYI